MPTESAIMSRRDSWPPTQLRLQPKGSGAKTEEPRPLLDDIDEDPLTYFLTPTPNREDDDDFDMAFDAGIEDPSQPTDIVRSVSPSSLDGLRRDRPSSPECDSDITSPDEDEGDEDDDDDEDYIRFTPQNSRLTSFRDLHIDGLGARTRSPIFGRSTNALLSPSSFPAPTLYRGRQPRTSGLRPRPTQRLWRQPSADVWSIQEETEDEVTESKLGDSVDGLEGDRQEEDDEQGTMHVEELRFKRAAKPQKRVRFALPTRN